MAKINAKIIYDKEEDILNLSRGNPSKASIEVGDFILDIGFDGFVSSIEILNASENLSLDKNILESINQIIFLLFWLLILKGQKKKLEFLLLLI